MRADRIGSANAFSDDEKGVSILCETNLEKIFESIKEVEPEILVIDSIQTIATETQDSSPGSIVQVRECASMLLRYAKTSGTPVLLIGHITKEGTLAGPKILEHIVDTVIQFEGDQNHIYRILRSIKNRFGSTSELGIYEMQHNGLRQVSNPSNSSSTKTTKDFPASPLQQPWKVADHSSLKHRHSFPLLLTALLSVRQLASTSVA